MYVFPGIGLGTILSKATVVTQSMIYASALALSKSLNKAERSQGWLYPEIARIRDVSVVVAIGVIRAAEEAGVAREMHIKSLNDEELEKWVRSKMYEPHTETARVEEEVRGMLEDRKRHSKQRDQSASAKMLNRIIGKSNEANDQSRKSSSRPSNGGQKRDTQKRSGSLILTDSTTRSSSRRSDERDPGFNPTSTGFSSTSRASYEGVAAPSVASSYAIATGNGDGEPYIPPGLVRNASLVDKIPRSRSSHKDVISMPVDDMRDDGRRSKGRRERSRSRDRTERRDKRERRDKKDKARRDSGTSKPGNGGRGEVETSRGSAEFGSQIGSAGFMQFPGQYDATIPGPIAVPSERPGSISSHVQDQFPGQFPVESSAPYRPPLASSEGGPGLAADYYGDAGESVAQQPGYRKHSPSLIIGAEPHLQPASSIAAPPPEPSASGAIGAAASFFNDDFDDSASTNPQQNPSLYTSAPSRPDGNNYSASAPVIPTVGDAALGASAGYAMSGGINGASSSHQQRPGYAPSLNSPPSEFSISTTQGHPLQTQASLYSSSARPPRPGKTTSHSSHIPQYAAGTAGTAALAGAVHSHDQHTSAQHTSMTQQYPATIMRPRHRHHGPLGAVLDFFKDPDGVAQFEEYSEIIGVCRGCFEPGSSPRDAPRKHRFYKRRSKERLGSSSRIDKQNRYSSSEDEGRRKKDSSWLSAGLGAGFAGYGLGKVGERLFNQRKVFDDTYDVRSGRVSPDSRSQVSGKASEKRRQGGLSPERMETGITSDGKAYKNDPHGRVFGGPTKTIHTRRRRSKSRSTSRDRKSGHADAAVGDAVGLAVAPSSTRRRSQSPKKAFVTEKHHSPERRRKQKEKKTEKGFFSFLSPASSSSSLELTSRTDKEKARRRRRLSDTIKNDREAEAALLGLGAAAAALALKEGRSSNKSKGNIATVKSTREKPRRQSGKSKHSSVSSEEVWESASEGEISYVDSDLAFGSPSRRSSRESLSSQTSGTDKWDWRWGSTKKRKGSPKGVSKNTSFPLPEGAAGAARAGAAEIPSNQHHRPAIDSTSSLPLQHVYPVPTSDPGRFDVRREGSIASSSQPVTVSRPEPVPIQQPRPIAPVSATFYVSQGPDSHSYSAPTGPQVPSQPSHSEDAPVPGNATIISRYDQEMNKRPGDFGLQRRGTSPARLGEDPISSSMIPRHRQSAKEDSSAVRFALSEEQEEKDRILRRRRRNEEKEEEERRGFRVKSSENEPNKRRESVDQAQDKHPDPSWIAPAVGVAGIAVGSAISTEKSKKDEAHEERRERRRRERAREDELDALRRGERRRRKERDREREQDREANRRPDESEQDVTIRQHQDSRDKNSPARKMSPQEEVGSKAFAHEDYQSFFRPFEILGESDNQDKITSADPDADVEIDRSAAIVEIAPKSVARQADEPEWSVADTNDHVDLSNISLPWQVPRLKVVQPTPPISRASTPSFAPTATDHAKGQHATKEGAPSKITWDDDQTHENTEVPPIESLEDTIKSAPNEAANPRRARNYSESESEDWEQSRNNQEQRASMNGGSSGVSPSHGDDYEFAATLAAGAEDAGFDPSIVIDDPTYRRRDSPPGSNDRSMPGGFDNVGEPNLSKKDKGKGAKAREGRGQADMPEERNGNASVEDTLSQVKQADSQNGDDGVSGHSCDSQTTVESKKGRKDSESNEDHIRASKETLEGRTVCGSQKEMARRAINEEAVDGQVSGKKPRKKSKRQSSGFDDAVPTVSSNASVEGSNDTKSKAKKGSLWDRVIGRSKENLSQSNASSGAPEQANVDDFEQPKKRSKKSKDHKPNGDGQDENVSTTSRTSKFSDKDRSRRSIEDSESGISGRITQDLPVESKSTLNKYIPPAGSVSQYLDDNDSGTEMSRPQESEPFLGVRPEPPPPPDIHNPQEEPPGRSGDEVPTLLEQDPSPAETYPPLPKSHSTSAASSVRDTEEPSGDYDYERHTAESNDDPRDVLIASDRAAPQPDLLDSQITPTAASFGHQVSQVSLSSPTSRPTSMDTKDAAIGVLIGGSIAAALGSVAHDVQQTSDLPNDEVVQLQTAKLDMALPAGSSPPLEGKEASLGEEHDFIPTDIETSQESERNGEHPIEVAEASTPSKEKVLPIKRDDPALQLEDSLEEHEGSNLTKGMPRDVVVQVMTAAAEGHDGLTPPAPTSGEEGFSGSPNRWNSESEDSRPMEQEKSLKQENLPEATASQSKPVAFADPFASDQGFEDTKSVQATDANIDVDHFAATGTNELSPLTIPLPNEESIQATDAINDIDTLATTGRRELSQSIPPLPNDKSIQATDTINYIDPLVTTVKGELTPSTTPLPDDKSIQAKEATIDIDPLATIGSKELSLSTILLPDDESIQAKEATNDADPLAIAASNELSPSTTPLPDDDDLDLLDPPLDDLQAEAREPIASNISKHNSLSHFTPISRLQATEETPRPMANNSQTEQAAEDHLFPSITEKEGKMGEEATYAVDIESRDEIPQLPEPKTASVGSEQLKTSHLVASQDQPRDIEAIANDPPTEQAAEEHFLDATAGEEGNIDVEAKHTAGIESGDGSTRLLAPEAASAGSEQLETSYLTASQHQPETIEEKWAVPVSKKRSKKGKKQESLPADLQTENEPAASMDDTHVRKDDTEDETEVSKASREIEAPVIPEPLERELVPVANVGTAAAVGAILAGETLRQPSVNSDSEIISKEQIDTANTAERPAEDYDIDFAASKKKREKQGKEMKQEIPFSVGGAAVEPTAKEPTIEPMDDIASSPSRQVLSDEQFANDRVLAGNNNHGVIEHSVSVSQDVDPLDLENHTQHGESRPGPATEKDDAIAEQLVKPTPVIESTMEAEQNKESSNQEEEEQSFFAPQKSKRDKKKAKKARKVDLDPEETPTLDNEPSSLPETSAAAAIIASVPIMSEIPQSSGDAGSDNIRDINVDSPEGNLASAKKKKKKKNQKSAAFVSKPSVDGLSQQLSELGDEPAPINTREASPSGQASSGDPSGTITPEPSHEVELANEFSLPKSKDKKKKKKSKAFDLGQDENNMPMDEPESTSESALLSLDTTFAPAETSLLDKSSTVIPEANRELDPAEEFTLPESKTDRNKTSEASDLQKEGDDMATKMPEPTEESAPFNLGITPAPIETSSLDPSNPVVPELHYEIDPAEEFALPKSKKDKKKRKSKAIDLHQDDDNMPTIKPETINESVPVDLGVPAAPTKTTLADSSSTVIPKANREIDPAQEFVLPKTKRERKKSRRCKTSLREDDVVPMREQALVEEAESIFVGSEIPQERVRPGAENTDEAEGMSRDMQSVGQRLHASKTVEDGEKATKFVTGMPEDEAAIISVEKQVGELDPPIADHTEAEEQNSVKPDQSELNDTRRDTLTAEEGFTRARALSFDEAGTTASAAEEMAETVRSDLELSAALPSTEMPIEPQEFMEERPKSNDDRQTVNEGQPIFGESRDSAVVEDDLFKRVLTAEDAPPTVHGEPSAEDVEESGPQDMLIENQDGTLSARSAGVEEIVDQPKGPFEKQQIVDEKKTTEANVDADASPMYDVGYSGKDVKQAEKSKALQLNEESMTDKPFATPEAETNFTEPNDIDKPHHDDMLELEAIMAGDGGIKEISSQQGFAEEVMPTEVDGPQGEVLEKGPEARYQRSYPISPDRSSDDDQVFEHKGPVIETTQVEGDASGTKDAHNKSAERLQTLADAEVTTAEHNATPQTVDTSGSKDLDDGPGVQVEKCEKDRKKSKSVKITSEDPEIIDEPPVEVIEPPDVAPIDTPISIGSIDLLDAEEQREYNEEYARELERQLRGDADGDLVSQHSYEPALPQSSSPVSAASPSQEHRETLAKATSLEDVTEEPRLRSESTQAPPADGEDDFTTFKPTKKSKKDKKRKKQQSIIWGDETATEGTVQEPDPGPGELGPNSKTPDLEEAIVQEPQEHERALSPIIVSPSLGRGLTEVQGDVAGYFDIQPAQRAEQDVGREPGSDRRLSVSTEIPPLAHNDNAGEPELGDHPKNDEAGEQSTKDEWSPVPAKKSETYEELQKPDLRWKASAPLPESEGAADRPYEAVVAPVRSDEASSAPQDNSPQRDSHDDDYIHATPERADSDDGSKSGEAAATPAAPSTAVIVAEALSQKASKRDKKKNKKRRKANTMVGEHGAKQEILDEPSERPRGSQVLPDEHDEQHQASQVLIDEHSEQPQASQKIVDEHSGPLPTTQNARDRRGSDDTPTQSPLPGSLQEHFQRQRSVHTLSPTRGEPQYRDSAIHVPDSPTIPESGQVHRGGRDSGYPDTETSPLINEDAISENESTERDIIEFYGDGLNRQSTFSEPDLIDSYHDKSGDGSGARDLHQDRSSTIEPLHVNTQTEDDYKVATPEARSKRRRSRRSSGDVYYDSDDSADSGFDIQKRRRRLQALAEEQREPSPVSSTTKDRSSGLFDSSPSERNEVRERLIEHTDPRDHSMPDALTHEDSQHGHNELISEQSWSFRHTENDVQEQRPSIFGSPVRENDAVSRSKSPASSDNRGRRLLRTISERSNEQSPRSSLQGKNKDTLSDIGSLERGVKAAMTPRKGLDSETLTRGTPSADELKYQFSEPAADKGDHSVNLERSRSSHKDGISRRHSNASAVPSISSIRTDLHSPSIGSPDSIHAIIRTPDQVRSASGQSFRSSGTPPLRRVDRSASGDLRGASKKSRAKTGAKISEEADSYISLPSSSTYDPLIDKGKNKADMADYEGWGDVRSQSPMSPTRPPSMRKRQSMQFAEMEQRLAMLASENGLLQSAKTKAEKRLEEQARDHSQQRQSYEDAIQAHKAYIAEKDSTLNELDHILDGLKQQVAHLTEANEDLIQSRTHHDWEQTSRELEALRLQHTRLANDHEEIVLREVEAVREEKEVELRQLREELEDAKEQVRKLQQQILASRSSDNIVEHDEDYFDAQCQGLCKHLTSWVTRFSKLSDNKRCYLAGEIRNETYRELFEDSMLDGSEVDDYLQDRHKRRDVFMSVTMSLIFKHIFARYLFGMDHEHRQKLKALDKTLQEVGPPSAVHKWRATTLTLLSRRPAFQSQRDADSEAVVKEIWSTLSSVLPPPPTTQASQCQESLRRIINLAVDLSIDMRLQRAEYSMLPPPEPEFDTNGDIRNKLYFKAVSMNERSGAGSSNEEIEEQGAYLRMVLFPLVVKSTDDEEQIVVCPAQVHVAPLKKGKTVRVMSAQGGRSEASYAPSEDMPMEGGMF
ncbi:MAG: hypothetical protein Q9217_001463 [Psora testacea]